MSSTLREASKDTLQAKDKTYHYYSLPLAAKSLGDITRKWSATTNVMCS